MAITDRYLTSTKKLPSFLNSVQGAQPPDKFTIAFLEDLGYKSSSDRLLIGMLKALGFLDDGGKPTERYYEYLDQEKSGRVLAEGMREAYSSLFQIDVNANKLTQAQVKNKLKTLTKGEYSDAVLTKMTKTFVDLVKHADFSAVVAKGPDEREEDIDVETPEAGSLDRRADQLGGLVYKIELILPDTRDPAVYDALFRSLKEHLL